MKYFKNKESFSKQKAFFIIIQANKIKFPGRWESDFNSSYDEHIMQKM